MIFTFLLLSTTQSNAAPKEALNRDDILEAETLLSKLGYWITKVDGKKDSSTYHALVAFQKVEGRKRTGVLTRAELAALRKAGRPMAKYSQNAHLEIDITRQVLFFVDDSGIVLITLPVSTGNEERYEQDGKWEIAHTPRGSFYITRKINGIRHAPLGDLYYPNYFYGGVAIHGSLSVPPYPASHGCVRIPLFAAKDFFDIVWLEMPVIVYD